MIEHAQKKSYIQNVHKKEKKKEQCAHTYKNLYTNKYIYSVPKKKVCTF